LRAFADQPMRRGERGAAPHRIASTSR